MDLKVGTKVRFLQRRTPPYVKTNEVCVVVGIEADSGPSEVRRRFEAEQRFAFLNKPFDQATLRAAIDALGLAPQG